MYRIYSRPRIRIPKIFFRAKGSFRNKRSKKIVKVLIIFTIAFLTVKIILDSVLPIFDTLCENEAKSLATIISNEQATNVMTEHSYDELFTVEKDANGNVTMIKSNVIPINEIISDVAIKIQEEINKQGRQDIEIALGSFTGIKLLAGRGPGIKIRISTVGNVETDLRSEFEAQGINQTLHRIYLQVKCEVSILTPFKDITKDITNQVLIMENVIIGTVPNTYYNIEGIGTNDALEFVE